MSNKKYDMSDRTKIQFEVDTVRAKKFKAACAARGVTIRQVMILFMDAYLKKEAER